MMANHADIQDKIQRWWQFAATPLEISFVLALNKVNVVAVTTIPVLHVGVIRVIMTSCSLAARTMRACAQGAPGGLAPRPGGLGGHSASPGRQESFGDGTRLNLKTIIQICPFWKSVKFTHIRNNI